MEKTFNKGVYQQLKYIIKICFSYLIYYKYINHYEIIKNIHGFDKRCHEYKGFIINELYLIICKNKK